MLRRYSGCEKEYERLPGPRSIAQEYGASEQVASGARMTSSREDDPRHKTTQMWNLVPESRCLQ